MVVYTLARNSNTYSCLFSSLFPFSGAHAWSELFHLVRTLRCPSDLGGLQIRARNNHRHVLLQRYACKRVRLEREASGLHNSWNSCFILRNRSRNDLRRPEIQNLSRGIPVDRPCARIYLLMETPANFCLCP